MQATFEIIAPWILNYLEVTLAITIWFTYPSNLLRVSKEQSLWSPTHSSLQYHHKALLWVQEVLSAFLLESTLLHHVLFFHFP